MSCFRFVDDHHTGYPVKRLCELVEIPRSSYYEWASRPLSDHYLDDAWLANEIYDIHVASRRTYGAPRVSGQLRNRGRRCARKRVARIMAECGFVGAHGRRKWRRGKANTAPAPDLLQRDFTAAKSDQRWVADITEFACLDGKLFLAGIKDLHDQGLAGWSMGERQTTDLVVNALVMALARRAPDKDLIHHADRGSQGELNWSSQHLDHGGVQRWRRCGSGSGRSSSIEDRSRHLERRRSHGARTACGSGRRSPAG